MMVREGFDSSLSELKTQVVQMMDDVDEIMEKSVRSLIEQDMETARWAISFDDVIDSLRDDIEERCIDLLALQQPPDGLVDGAWHQRHDDQHVTLLTHAVCPILCLAHERRCPG